MLEVKDLYVQLDTESGIVKAVDGVSFSVKPGQTIGIVGESGSGKSVLAQSLMQLNPTPPASYSGGEIIFENADLLRLNDREIREIRGNEIAMIFQDPMSSLNPVFKIGAQLIEAVKSHQRIKKKVAKERALKLLADVGIPDPSSRMNDYPHQFSGGMRQRVMIAMALASNPKLLIADEPTTALDVTIQAEIMDLLRDLKEKYNMAMIVITHDLGVVANLADEIIVMYAGRIVEKGKTNEIFYAAEMPYTEALLRSSPSASNYSNKRLISIMGQPPNLADLPKGCKFSPRCPFSSSACLEKEPELTQRSEQHYAACIFSADELSKRKHILNY